MSIGWKPDPKIVEAEAIRCDWYCRAKLNSTTFANTMTVSTAIPVIDIDVLLDSCHIETRRMSASTASSNEVNILSKLPVYPEGCYLWYNMAHQGHHGVAVLCKDLMQNYLMCEIKALIQMQSLLLLK